MWNETLGDGFVQSHASGHASIVTWMLIPGPGTFFGCYSKNLASSSSFGLYGISSVWLLFTFEDVESEVQRGQGRKLPLKSLTLLTTILYICQEKPSHSVLEPDRKRVLLWHQKPFRFWCWWSWMNLNCLNFHIRSGFSFIQLKYSGHPTDMRPFLPLFLSLHFSLLYF